MLSQAPTARQQLQQLRALFNPATLQPNVTGDFHDSRVNLNV
jgi:hypothetical protein